MKTKLSVLIFLLAAALAQAQTNNLTVLLQQGLFEEQANRNLDAAIADYTSLAAQFDKDRQLAATAVFRLGECYRAQGKTNEAAAQYQRVLRDFSGEQTLATLSRQNLTGMGVGTQQSSKLDSEDVSQLSAQLAELEKLKDNPEKQARVVLALFPDEGLKRMLLHLPLLQENELAFQNNLPDKPGRFLYALSADGSDLLSQESRFGLAEAQRELKKQFQFIAQRVDFILGLQKERYALLKEMAGPAPVKNSSPADEEDVEIQRIQQMIQNSPDLINARVDGYTPLANAARKGWLKVATYLMDHGAEVNGSYALSAAVNSGNRAMVELLLSRGADVSEMDNSNGRSLLQAAVQKGYQSVAEVLLANKADVNKPDNSGNTPLVVAAAASQAKIAKMLLSAGANLNLANDNGRTPLSFAAEHGSPEMRKLLLDAKADPNGGKLDAPLFCAIYKQDLASAELLLQAGANPNAAGAIDLPVRPNSANLANHSEHLTPLWLAIYTKQLPLVQLLLKYKADPDDSQTDGKSLLFSALADTNILEALLDAGAKVDARDNSERFYNGRLANKTLLRDAAAEWPDAVEILLKHGADANARDGLQQTPLHYATGISENSQNRKIIELLLAYKADPNVRSEGGQTPLDLLKQTVAANTSENSPLAPSQRLSPEQLKLAGELIDLLRQHGALDKLPDWDRITVSRPSANFSQAVFQKGTNDWNQFTLLETIFNAYSAQMEFPLVMKLSFQDRLRLVSQGYSGGLPFPDLAQVTIVRHRPGTTNETQIKINLLNSTNGIDCAKDLPLEFGDVVEIPAINHALGEQTVGLTEDELQTIAGYLKGNVQLMAHGRKVELPIYSTPAGAKLGAVLQQPDAQKVLLLSSDLSRVKVTRRDAKTGKSREWMVDCSDWPASSGGRVVGNSSGNAEILRDSSHPSSDLWLRNGDVIEVPEKP